MAQEFTDWRDEVDNCIQDASGITSDELPPRPYRAWYGAGMTPHQAALKALEENGFEEGELDD